jgi:hypothetical protein
MRSKTGENRWAPLHSAAFQLVTYGLQMDNPTTQPWPWPETLDAMVAAPGFHTVLFEDERVRVLDGIVKPGELVPVHTHRWAGVLYILGTSDFVRRDPVGTVLVDTRVSHSTPRLGVASWAMPLTPHTFENVGTSDFHTLTVEMKDTGPDTPT